MAGNKIQLKRTSITGREPSAIDLDVGELAINLADSRLFTKNGSNAVVDVHGQSLNTTAAVQFANVTVNNLAATTIAGNIDWSYITSKPDLKIDITGDAVGNATFSDLANGSINVELSNTTVAVGTYGNSSAIPVITIDSKGRITTATTNAVAGVTGFTYTPANSTLVITTGDGSTFPTTLTSGNSSVQGLLRVVDSVANTSATIAASANAVKTAYDLAIAANTTASQAYSNAVAYADTRADAAYSNAVLTAATDATNKAANAYSNAISVASSDATSKAATAYSNAVSTASADATSKADAAYSNAVSTAASDATNKADTAYSNAVAYAAANTYVNTTFAPKASPAFTGEVTVTGNLVVTGTTTFVNTNVFQISDEIITLNADATGSATANVGFEVNRGADANTFLIWDEALNKWSFTNDGSTYYQIASNTDVDAAYSNAVSTASADATSKAATAYSNAISTAAADATNKADTAYSNAIAYAAANTYVNTTFAPLVGATFTGAVVVGNTIAVGNTTITGFANVTSTLQVAANVILGDTRIIANGGVGSAGQVLTSGGGSSNVYWSTAVGSGGGSSNGFGTIAVSGQSDVVADLADDTLTLAAGAGINITTNAATDTITIAQSAIAKQSLTGNGSNTVFVLSSNTVGADDILVYVDGEYYHPEEDYDVIVAGELTFTTAPTNNAKIRIRYLRTSALSVPTSNTSSSGDLSSQTGTEDLESGTGTEDLMDGDGSSLEGDLITSTGTEDLETGTGTEDLMDGSTPTPLQDDLITSTGTEDLQSGTGTEDLLN